MNMLDLIALGGECRWSMLDVADERHGRDARHRARRAAHGFASHFQR